jgi:hypothetical protein
MWYRLACLAILIPLSWLVSGCVVTDAIASAPGAVMDWAHDTGRSGYISRRASWLEFAKPRAEKWAAENPNSPWKNDVLNHVVRIGMPMDAVRASWGEASGGRSASSWEDIEKRRIWHTYGYSGMGDVVWVRNDDHVGPPRTLFVENGVVRGIETGKGSVSEAERIPYEGDQ